AQKNQDKEAIRKIKDQIASKNLLAKKVKAEARYQEKKADYDSLLSLYHIAVEHRNAEQDEARRKTLTTEVERAEQHLKELKEGKDGLDERNREFENAMTDYDRATAELARLEKPLTDALAELKKVNTEFDRYAKNAAQKHWGL